VVDQDPDVVVDGGVLGLLGDEEPHSAKLYLCWRRADDVPGHSGFRNGDSFDDVRGDQTVVVTVTRLRLEARKAEQSMIVPEVVGREGVAGAVSPSGATGLTN